MHPVSASVPARSDTEKLRASLAHTIRMILMARAQALGLKPPTLLSFADPKCTQVELRGRRGTFRRLDRAFGGPPIIEVEAHQPVSFTPPCHYPAPMLLTRGSARLDHEPLPPYTGFQVGRGQTLTLKPGGVVLVRDSPIHALIEAACAAGIGTNDLFTEVLRTAPLKLMTPAGALALDRQELRAHVQDRLVRLTAQEALAMQSLFQNPGGIVSRQEIAAALRTSLRAVDRVIVQLRNKLGDGLITTVYGAGYLLEAAPAEIKPD